MMGAILLSKKSYPEEDAVLPTDEALMTLELPHVKVLGQQQPAASLPEKELVGAGH